MYQQVKDRFPYRLIISITALLKRIMLLMLLYSLVRLLFLIYNYNLFKPYEFSELLKVFFFGMRFDYAVIFYLNIPFILIHFVSVPSLQTKKFQNILKVAIVIINGLIIIPSFIDITYFQFINKRSSVDLIRLFLVSKDVVGLIPLFFIDYWHVTILWLAFVFTLWKFYPPLRFFNIKSIFVQGSNWGKKTLVICLIPLYLLISMVIARGLELKPLRIISAIDYVKADYTPLILNTPFVIVNTIDHQDINTIEYFTLDKACNLAGTVKKYPISTNHDSQLNVVIIILESFSKEYIGSLNNLNKGYTPFLDSLYHESYSFTNAFANGKRSIEALPAILSSFPPLTEDPLISTKYSTNKQSSLPLLLKQHGYHTSFFHGGTNGTMGFDKFCRSIGVDHYFGKNEYAGDGDDGHWGIFDEEFLQFFADKLSTFPQPFISTVFSLTSHHPYPIPEKYKNIFTGGDLPIHPTIKYTDYALKRFFESASKTKWFNNTLFVITADHTAQATTEFYNNRVGNYSIPLMFYWPANKNFNKIDSSIVQQADIYPSIAHLLGIKDTFVSFGNNIFADTSKFSVNLYKRTYQIIDDNFVLIFDGEKSLGLYNYKRDSLLTNNLLDLDTNTTEGLEDKLKALLQIYTWRIANNKLTDTTPCR